LLHNKSIKCFVQFNFKLFLNKFQTLVKRNKKQKWTIKDLSLHAKCFKVIGNAVTAELKSKNFRSNRMEVDQSSVVNATEQKETTSLHDKCLKETGNAVNAEQVSLNFHSNQMTNLHCYVEIVTEQNKEDK